MAAIVISAQAIPLPSLLVSAVEPDEQMLKNIYYTDRKDWPKLWEKHEYARIDLDKGRYALVHESVLNRKNFELKKWFLDRLNNGLIDSKGAFSLARMTPQEKEAAKKLLSSSMPQSTLDMLEKTGGDIFLNPSSTLYLSDGKNRQMMPFSQRLLQSKETVDKAIIPDYAIDFEDNSPPEPPAGPPALLEKLNFRFLDKTIAVLEKRDMLNQTTALVLEELDQQGRLLATACQQAILKAMSGGDPATIQMLSKGGKFSDLPQEMRRSIESWIVDQYDRNGFASREQAMEYLQNAKFEPLDMTSMFTIYGRTKEGENSSNFSQSFPANLHRSG